MATREEREAFFKHLDSLDQDNTASEGDSPVKLRPSKIRKLDFNDSVRNKPDITTDKQPTKIANTDASSSVPKLVRAETDTLELNSRRPELPQASKDLRRTNSEPKHVATVPTTSRATKALFAGCSLYFIPNNDVAKVRKLRMQSAISQGARWIRTVNDEITHIIVDAHLTANDVKKSLSGRIDLTSVPIVKDKWLIESLTHKILKDVRQDRFVITGLPVFAQKPLIEDLSSGHDNTALDKGVHVDSSTEPVAPSNIGPIIEPEDELASILKEVKNNDQLPLDPELDLDRFISLSSGDESEDVKATAKVKSSSKENRGFACMEPHTGKSDDNPNNRTIEVLQMMATYYDRTGDHWRTTAYRKAIAALRKQTQLISTKEEALQIFGIGGRLADKIEEIVTTNRLQKLESTLADPNDKVLQLFMDVYGAGVKQARLWIDQNYRTLGDLKRNAPLTENQKIGIDHYDDFQQRIPRTEVAQHGQIVQKALHRADKQLTAIIGGSYRRGMPDSGDIDVMITHRDAELPQLREWVFETAVPYMFKIGFMKYAFATSRSQEKTVYKTPVKSQKHKPNLQALGEGAFADCKSTGTKFHGASVLPGPNAIWRRIDLLLVPASALGASLLYFTGNDIFNRSIRLLASRRGMRLNQYGLYKNVLRGKGRVKETEGELLEGGSEKRIFEILGVPWREPEERRC